MEQFQKNYPEQMDNNDYDTGDSEDFLEGLESLASDAEEDIDMYERSLFRTIPYQREDSSAFRFPGHIKRKEDMNIEDVIKYSALHFLPAKSLFRFKTVCKNWDQWINGPFLAHRQSHTFRSISGIFCLSPDGDCLSFISLNPKAYGIPSPSLSFLPESVDILSTSNGLLCCKSCNEDNMYYICNPATEEWKLLPKPSLYHGSKPATVLGFEPSQSNFLADYNLICAVTLLDQPVTCFEIYNSAQGSWRVSEEICCDEDALIIKSEGGFYLKGVAYWEIGTSKALAFDLKEEQWGILPLPLCTGTRGILTEREGELCYVIAHKNQDNTSCRIEIYGDIDMQLKDLLNPPLPPYFNGECRALPCLNSELLIILVGRKIYSYHVTDEKFELLRDTDRDDCTRYLPYVNSLVSLAN